MSLLITNATLVTLTERGILPNHALYIEGNTILDIAPHTEMVGRYPHADLIDAGGSLVLPGNIVAHTHFYGAYARGMAIPGPAPREFPEILQRLWWCLDKALDSDTVRLSALVHLVDAIKHGATTLIDHHASPNAIDGSLDIISQAVQEAGLRAVLCYEVTDRDGRDKAEAGIAENVRFIQQNADHPSVRGTFGLHASLTLSDTTLKRCVLASQGLDTGFHIHVAEHPADQEDSLVKSGKRVVHRLEDFGVLGPKTIVAHAVHCNAWELATLKKHNTWLTHQPRSNMNNAVGAADIETMLAGEMRVCLGTDGFSNNMYAEWKTAYLLHKLAHLDPRRASGDKIAQMALLNNAQLAHQFFPAKPLGILAEGALADLIILDYYPYTPLTAENLPWHVLFGVEASMVNTTIVAGRVLMRNREVLTLNERAIAEEALRLAPAIWERYRYYAKGVLG